MATCNFEQSQDRDRFMRLTRLLIAGGTPILRNILKLYLNPTTLAGALRGTGVRFTKPQKELVFPPSGLPDFDKFDISLIFKLLRNCCGLTEPATKWNGFPAENDNSLEADIVRIDFYRNDIYGHALEHMGLTQQEFDQYWRIISDTLCRRATHLPGMNVTDLLDKIQGLKWALLTDDDRRMFEEDLLQIYSKLDNIEAKEDQIKEGIEGLQDTMFNAFQRTNISNDKTPTVAASSVHYHFTNIQFSPQFSSNGAQVPQPFEPKEMRRQISDSSISHSSPHQRPYKKSCSLPSNVGLRTPSSQPQVDRFFSQFQNPQTAGEYQQVSDHLWKSPNQTPATFEPHQESNSASFYAGQEKSPARSSQERSGNFPEEFSFQFQNPRADAEYQVSSHGRQSLNPTAAPFAPRRESDSTSFYIGQEGPPDSWADQAAAPRTWPSSSNHSFYHTTSKDRQASPVSPRLLGSNEWPKQQQQQLLQDPLLRIKISVSGAGSSGFHLREVVQSVLDISDEMIDASQFTTYLKKHQVVIKKIEGNGDCCCIGVSPRDLKSLQDLWLNFIYEDLKEFVKETLLPEDFTGEVDVDIDAEEYKRCCESLRPRGFKDSGRQLHSQSLSRVGLAFNDVTEPASETIRMRSQSAMDLRSTVTDASQELFQLICKNGGRMHWQTALGRLSYSSYIELTKPAFKHNRQFEFLPNNVVQVKVSLKFCPRMRKDNTCNNTLCPDLHLCRFYFLGGCKFPMNCKNSHDISDHHTNNVFKMANLSFLNDEERKQLLRNLAYVVPEICTYYNGISKQFGSCTKGYNCPYLHVCEDWVLVGRVCVAGRACRRAHTFSNQHEQNILKKRNLDQLSEEKVLEKLNEHYS